MTWFLIAQVIKMNAKGDTDMFEVSQGLDLLKENAPSYNFAEHKFKVGVSAYGTKEEEVCDDAAHVCETTLIKESVSFDNLKPLFESDIFQVEMKNRKETDFTLTPVNCDSLQNSTNFITEKGLCYDSVNLQGDSILGDGKAGELYISWDEDCLKK
jgi:hypothetical protein